MTFNNRFSAWTNFTPTFSTSNADGNIGNGTLSGLWRRSGDSIDITIRMICGTTTNNGTGTFLISGPSSFTIDTSKIVGGNGGIISGYCFLEDV